MVQVKILYTDVSRGQAKLYHTDRGRMNWYYGLGISVAELIDKSYVKNMPMVLYHSMIMVDGEMYEFTVDGGLRRTPNYQPQNQEQVPTVIAEARSSKSYDEWTRWASSSLQKFIIEKYDKVYNNCLHFVEDACKFLGVEFPREFSDFLIWLKQYPMMVKAIGIRSNSGSSEAVGNASVSVKKGFNKQR